MRKIIKNILLFMLLILLFFFTIKSALADEYYELSPGTSTGIISIMLPENSNVSYEGMFFTNTKVLHEKDYALFSYVIHVENGTNIDRYDGSISIRAMNYSRVIPVVVDVQPAWFLVVKKNTLWWLLIPFVVFVLFFLFIYFRRFLRRILFKKVVFFSIIGALVIGLFSLFFMGVFTHSAGSIFEQRTGVSCSSGNVQNMIIDRDARTPGTADWVVFKDTNKSRTTCSKKTLVAIPDIIPNGIYYYKLIVNVKGEENNNVIVKKIIVV